jgi:tetratricopeptide (TPR) repeat protein
MKVVSRFRWAAALLALPLAFSSCAVGPDDAAAPLPEPEAPAPVPAPVPAPAPGQEPPTPEPGPAPEPPPVPDQPAPARGPQDPDQAKYQDILQKFLERSQISDQERELESRKWYDIAVHYKSINQLENAKVAVERALAIWPGNRNARMLKDDLDRILRHPGRVPPEKVQDLITAQWKGQIIEALNHIRSGERYLASKEYEKAQHEFQEAEVQIMAMPDQLPEKGSFLPVVRDYLRKIRDAISNETKVKIELDRRRAEHEQKVLADAEKKEVVRKIAQLLEMAYMTFDQRRYEACAHLCDKILWIDPNYLVARELKEDALKAQVRREYRDMVIRRIQGWKAMTQSDNEARIPYMSVINYPDHDTWLEISKRAQESVLKSIEDTEEPEPIVAVRTKLRSMKVDLNYQDTPLREVMAFLREYTGLNIMVDPAAAGEIDESATVNFKARGVTVATALKYILQQVNENAAYDISEEKIVMLTTKDKAMGKPIFELYDIRDLTLKLSNFPGPRLELLPGQGAGGGPGVSFTLEEPEEPKVSSDDIVTLIQENIRPQVWENSDLYAINMTPNHQLLVAAPADVHKEIRLFLEKLRSYSGVMVNVICRFLAAYDDFMQNVGWDLVNPWGAPQGPQVTDITDPSRVANPNNPWPWIPPFLEGGTLTGQIFHTLLTGDPAFASAGIAMTFDPIAGRMRQQGGLGMRFTVDGISAVLRAVDKHEKATVVHAPRVTAMNGQRAHILSVTRLAYIRDIDAAGVGFVGGLDLVIGYLNHGVVLDVRPIVSHDRKYVTMEVRADFAELVLMRPMDVTNAALIPVQGGPQLPPQPGQPPPTNPTDVTPYWIQLPYLVYQRINTTVMVPDRGTMIIGGFRDLQYADHYSGMPFVENIPILDFFFSRKGKKDEKRRLFILLTPEIVDVGEREKETFD